MMWILILIVAGESVLVPGFESREECEASGQIARDRYHVSGWFCAEEAQP